MKHNDGENIQCLQIFDRFLESKIEWTENEIHAFTEALAKFNDDWAQIANYVRRSEQSCRVFYQKYRKRNSLIEDERVSTPTETKNNRNDSLPDQNIDEDNGSISGSEDAERRATDPVKSREIDEGNRLKFDYSIHWQTFLVR